MKVFYVDKKNKGGNDLSTNIAGFKIPDRRLAVEAQNILKEHDSDLLWNHSPRFRLKT